MLRLSIQTDLSYRSSDGPMSVFLRPHAYLPTDAITNAKDFATVLQKSCKPESPKPESVLTMSDNGWDYSCDGAAP